MAQTYWVDPVTMLEVRMQEKLHFMSGKRVLMTEDMVVELVAMALVPR
jgi:hypothetical protein